MLSPSGFLMGLFSFVNAEIDTGSGLDKAEAMLDSILEGPVRQLRKETD